MEKEHIEKFLEAQNLMKNYFTCKLIDKDIFNDFHDELLKSSVYWLKEEFIQKECMHVDGDDIEIAERLLKRESIQDLMSFEDFRKLKGIIQASRDDLIESDLEFSSEEVHSDRLKDFKSWSN